MTTAAGWKVVDVVDTRDLVEDGDRFVRVPGSGVVRSCDRCGRNHEVHVVVEAPDGTRSVVGTGCSGGPLEFQARIRSVVSATATVATLAVRLEKARYDKDRWMNTYKAMEAKVVEMVPLEIEETSRGQVWRTPDRAAYVHVYPYSDAAERLRCLHDSWARTKAGELTGVRADCGNIYDLENRLKRARKRLASLQAESCRAEEVV